MTIKKLHARCKKLLYEIVYKRDADWRGHAKCVTCPKIMEVNLSSCHVGHFKHGKTKLIYYEPKNSHLQCNGCNTYRGGKGIEYTIFMIETYGKKTTDEIIKKASNPQIWTKSLLEEEVKSLEEQLKH